MFASFGLLVYTKLDLMRTFHMLCLVVTSLPGGWDFCLIHPSGLRNEVANDHKITNLD